MEPWLADIYKSKTISTSAQSICIFWLRDTKRYQKGLSNFTDGWAYFPVHPLYKSSYRFCLIFQGNIQKQDYPNLDASYASDKPQFQMWYSKVSSKLRWFLHKELYFRGLNYNLLIFTTPREHRKRKKNIVLQKTNFGI